MIYAAGMAIDLIRVYSIAVAITSGGVFNIVSKSMYGVTVAAKQLGFLAAITGVGLAGFAGSLWWFKHNLVGSELYYWMWWVVAGYYGLAIAAIQVRSFGVPGVIKGSFHDDQKDVTAPAAA